LDYSVRIRSNPNYYREVISLGAGAGLEELEEEEMHAITDVKPEIRLEQLVDQAIDSLTTEGLIDNFDNEIETTIHGDMLCAYNVRYHTFLTLKAMPRNLDIGQLLSYVSKAEEFKDIRFRSGEKQIYAEFNKREEIKYPVEVVQDTSDKVNLLMQMKMARMDLDALKQPNANPAAECHVVMNYAARISQCEP
jgi:ATP-dependent DNA helicase HFM1/MER3